MSDCKRVAQGAALSATSDAPPSTTEPTTGPDAPSVCLTPHPEGIAVATDAAQCINSEGVGGAIELIYETWPTSAVATIG
jgi:hypothetical protein